MVTAAVRVLRRPHGLRAGIVVGVAIALLGLAVGTATGATTPFQQVIVVNSPASPVPVSLQGTGTISGTVAVSNFPATQPVSGTVNVGNFPTPAERVASEHYTTGQRSLGCCGGNISPRFGRTINVSALGLVNTDGGRTDGSFSYTMQVELTLVGGGIFLVHIGDGSRLVTLPEHVPANGINVVCLNGFNDCDFEVQVVGD